MVLITDNRVLVNNVRELPSIMCVQRRAEKKIATEDDLIQANINSFGDEIGTTTNRITSMFEVQAMYHPDSKQYKTLDYRISCGQLYQQNSIDKTKGIIANPMPKSWYDRYANKIKDDDTEEEITKKQFNYEILADKKPYFMCYIYPQLMNDYKKHISNAQKSCILSYGIELAELESKEDKTDDEIRFLDYYHNSFPVGMNPCVINKIAWRFEEEFDDYLKKFKVNNAFDYSILKSNVPYKKSMYLEVSKLYEIYKKRLSHLSMVVRKERISVDHINNMRKQAKYYFIQECSYVCPNIAMLTDIVLDLCYKSNNSKQFAWDVCGDYIISNMLRKNSSVIQYPTKENVYPDFYYCGNGYKMKNYKYERLEIKSQWF